MFQNIMVFNIIFVVYLVCFTNMFFFPRKTLFWLVKMFRVFHCILKDADFSLAGTLFKQNVQILNRFSKKFIITDKC